MPTDANGIYSLPPGYLAITGKPILSSQHNPPLEDIQAALNGRVSRNGVLPMTGPLKVTDGTLSAPGIVFANAQTTGWVRTADGIGIVVGGVLVAEVTAAGLTNGGVKIGAGMDWWGDAAPSGWAFAYGQALSRTTFARLFGVFGTRYGAGDGSSTFNLPDKRDRASFGKGDMGGTAAGRITGQSGGWAGTTLGAAGGAEIHTLSIPQIPAHPHPITDKPHSHTPLSGGNFYVDSPVGAFVGGGAANFNGNAATASSYTGITATENAGGGAAHNNLPPGIVCNYIIFTGV